MEFLGSRFDRWVCDKGMCLYKSDLHDQRRRTSIQDIVVKR